MSRSVVKLSAAVLLPAVAWGAPQAPVAHGDTPPSEASQAPATTEPFHRTVVLKSELDGIQGKEMQAWVAELAPGGVIPKHYHPYDEFVYVLDGSVVMQVKGQDPDTLNVGDVGHAPAKTVHQAWNASGIFPAKALVFGLTIEGEPLAVPVK